jgi:hypothetical protein
MSPAPQTFYAVVMHLCIFFRKTVTIMVFFNICVSVHSWKSLRLIFSPWRNFTLTQVDIEVNCCSLVCIQRHYIRRKSQNLFNYGDICKLVLMFAINIRDPPPKKTMLISFWRLKLNSFLYKLCWQIWRALCSYSRKRLCISVYCGENVNVLCSYSLLAFINWAEFSRVEVIWGY